jgi:hypothetical protein
MKNALDTSATTQVFSQLASSLDRASLESLVGFHADERTQSRVDELAERCNAGTLSAAEARDYESYVEAARFIAILKAEARRILNSQDAA